MNALPHPLPAFSPPSPPPSPIALPIQNVPGNPWLVQKFGGTSIGKYPLGIVDVVQTYIKTHRVALVCSALSSEGKALGTTNRLLKAAEEAGVPGSEKWAGIVTEIREDHLAAVRGAVKQGFLADEVCREIERECRDLCEFLRAAQIIDEISPKSRDAIVGVGEKLSCLLVTAVLRDSGIDAVYVNLENILPPVSPTTDPPHRANKVTQPTFYPTLTGLLAKRVATLLPPTKIPVITGFFSPVPNSLLYSIGRGYTDLTAALLASALHAEELQIWKDVDGIFTADPRRVPRARLLERVSPAEAVELTSHGCEIVHPQAITQVLAQGISIRVGNVRKPRCAGSVISHTHARAHTSTDKRGRPTAVTTKEGIVVLNVRSDRKSLSHGFLAGVFGVLDRFGLTVNLISTSQVHVSMALMLAGSSAAGLDGVIEELERYGTVDLRGGLTILSLVGEQMRKMIGVAGRTFTALGEGGVNVEMISQGASEINISCVIEEKDAIRAMRILHDKLFG